MNDHALTTPERLRFGEVTLRVILQARERRREPGYMRSVERAIVDRELEELARQGNPYSAPPPPRSPLRQWGLIDDPPQDSRP
jgi:hypothetical protein